jgi:hypothetical protein
MASIPIKRIAKYSALAGVGAAIGGPIGVVSGALAGGLTGGVFGIIMPSVTIGSGAATGYTVGAVAGGVFGGVTGAQVIVGDAVRRDLVLAASSSSESADSALLRKVESDIRRMRSELADLQAQMISDVVLPEATPETAAAAANFSVTPPAQPAPKVAANSRSKGSKTPAPSPTQSATAAA